MSEHTEHTETAGAAGGRALSAGAASDRPASRTRRIGVRVVALIWQRNRGRASGAVVEYEYAQVWTLREGRATGQRTFVRQEDAARAVGLEG